jgi:hypothetical protein
MLHIIAAITQGEVIRQSLQHLKLAADQPSIAPARARQEALAWSSALTLGVCSGEGLRPAGFGADFKGLKG